MGDELTKMLMRRLTRGQAVCVCPCEIEQNEVIIVLQKQLQCAVGGFGEGADTIQLG